MSNRIGPDGHPIPEKQGVVGAVIEPVTFADPKQGVAGAKGAALDEHGNPIDQTALLAELAQLATEAKS